MARSERGTTLVIVNPASAGGKTERRWPDLRAALDAAGIAFSVHPTAGPGDATVAARDALRGGVQRIVAVGGDGTLNEVVNGFFSDDGTPVRADAELGILPSGTGGDFRKSIHIPLDPAKSVGILAGGKTRPVDAGKIEFADGMVRYFINIADCGIGGEVVARVNRSRFKGGGIRGTAVFLSTSLTVLMTFGSRDVDLTIDGETIHRSIQNVVLANGRYFGGGMCIAPNAELDDGKLDVVILKRMSRLQSLLGMPKIYKGTHLSLDTVETRRAAVVTVVPKDRGALLFDVEGEQVGQAPATIRCLPGALRLCVP